MSRRRSTGDLVPSDITEILAREARAQRGQKKPGSALGQAFSWLKGSRRKKNLNNELNRAAVGGTEGRLGVQNHDPAKGECVFTRNTEMKGSSRKTARVRCSSLCIYEDKNKAHQEPEYEENAPVFSVCWTGVSV